MYRPYLVITVVSHKIFLNFLSRSYYPTSSNFANTAGGREVVWVKISAGQFVNVKVTGRLSQTQQVKDGLHLAGVRHISHRSTL